LFGIQAEILALSKLPNVECFQLGGVVSKYGSAGKIDVAAVTKYVKAAVAAFGFGRTCFEGNW
jgi:predicted TIM-barrel fold metal-dependent hydrolase